MGLVCLRTGVSCGTAVITISLRKSSCLAAIRLQPRPSIFWRDGYQVGDPAQDTWDALSESITTNRSASKRRANKGRPQGMNRVR